MQYRPGDEWVRWRGQRTVAARPRAPEDKSNIHSGANRSERAVNKANSSITPLSPPSTSSLGTAEWQSIRSTKESHNAGHYSKRSRSSGIVEFEGS